MLRKHKTPEAATSYSRTHVGSVIRALRRSKRITIKDLAATLNRSTGYVSQLERGLSEPTLKDLYAACTIFGVPMSWFVPMDDGELPKGREGEHIVRADRRRSISQRGAMTEILTPELDRSVEFMISTYEPLLETEIKDVSVSGAEYGLILEGRLELWIDEEKFLLKKGDSYYFKRSSKYRSRNPSETEHTVICWVGVYI